MSTNEDDRTGTAIMFTVTGDDAAPIATLCSHHLGPYIERHQALRGPTSAYTVRPVTGSCRICKRDPEAGAWEYSDEFGSGRSALPGECVEPGDVVCPRLGNCTDCTVENGSCSAPET